MPRYDYRCSVCGRIAEHVANRNQITITAYCPCGRTSVHVRSFNPTNFILKGSGWAKDNYDNKSNKKEKKD